MIRVLLLTAWWGVKLSVFLAGAVGVALLSGLLTVKGAFQESEVVVPEVLGLSVDEATDVLARADLEILVEARRPHDAVEEGRIFFQEPLAGQSTRRRRQVKAVLSAGPGRVAVPDLSGQSARAAVLALRRWGLELGEVVRVHEARVAAGEIYAQDPPPGAAVHENAKIDVLASLGAWPRVYVMPDLRGWPLRRVEVALGSVGLRVAEVRQEIVPGQPAGVIRAQVPQPGAPVSADAGVSLVVTHQVERPVREMGRGPRLYTE